jgi:hypothetical protein
MTITEYLKKQPVNNNVIFKLRRKKPAAMFKETPLENLLNNGWNLPPQKLLELLKVRGQKMQLSWNWNDMGAAAHSKAFTVAKVMSADILQDVHNALVKARTEGWDLKKFKQNLLPTLESKGWTKRVVTSEQGTKTVNLGSRLTTIYNTNNAMDFSRSRFEEMSLTADSRPLWQYRQVQRFSKRIAHAKFHNKIFPSDDPIWKRIWPSSTWNCLCTVFPLKKLEVDIAAKRQGVPLKVESGKRYIKYVAQNQGEFAISPLKEWTPDVTKYVTGIKIALEKLLENIPQYQIDKSLLPSKATSIEQITDATDFRTLQDKTNIKFENINNSIHQISDIKADLLVINKNFNRLGISENLFNKINSTLTYKLGWDFEGKAGGVYQRSNSTIQINPSSRDSVKRNKAYDTGQLASNRPNASFAHEYGHHIWNYIFKTNEKLFVKFETALSKINYEIKGRASLGLKKQGLSKYAETQTSEMFAESIAQHLTMGQQPNTIGYDIIKILQETLSKLEE